MTYQTVERQKLEIAMATGFVWGVGMSLVTVVAMRFARRFK